MGADRGGGHQERAVTGIKVGPVDLVHGGGAGVGSALCPDVGVVVVVVVVGMVPGLGATLVQVAVQRGRCVGVGGGEGQLAVSGSCQGAAQGGWDGGGLVRAVPEGRWEAALAHREGAIWVKGTGKKSKGSNEHTQQALVSFPESPAPPQIPPNQLLHSLYPPNNCRTQETAPSRYRSLSS